MKAVNKYIDINISGISYNRLFFTIRSTVFKFLWNFLIMAVMAELYGEVNSVKKHNYKICLNDGVY